MEKKYKKPYKKNFFKKGDGLCMEWVNRKGKFISVFISKENFYLIIKKMKDKMLDNGRIYTGIGFPKEIGLPHTKISVVRNFLLEKKIVFGVRALRSSEPESFVEDSINHFDEFMEIK